MATTLDRERHEGTVPIEFSSPFLLRFGAFLIDYITLLILPVGGLLSDRLFSGGLNIFTNDTLWFLGVLISILNVVVLPAFTGQSVGKMLTGLRIISKSGTSAGVLQILGRQTLGYLVTAATLGLGFLFALFNLRGRTLHDLIFGTMVVRATRAAVRD